MDTPRTEREWVLAKQLAIHKLLLAQAHLAMAAERVKAAQAEDVALGVKFIASPLDAGAEVVYAKQAPNTLAQAALKDPPVLTDVVKFPRFEAAAQGAQPKGLDYDWTDSIPVTPENQTQG